jgi:hypothetical protein
MTHMAVMVNLRAGIAPMDSQAWAVTASPTVRQEYVRLKPPPLASVRHERRRSRRSAVTYSDWTLVLVAHSTPLFQPSNDRRNHRCHNGRYGKCCACRASRVIPFLENGALDRSS